MGADRNRSWPKVVAVVVLVVFVVLAIVGRLSGADDEASAALPSTTTTRTPKAVTTSGPASDKTPTRPTTTPLGGSPGEAATEWAETVGGLVYVKSGDARAKLTALSSSESAIDAELDDLEQRQENVAEADDEALIWSQFAPLGLKATTSDGRATVDVWGVWVQSADPVVQPVSAWIIWSVDLEKQGDGWSVVGSDRSEGPAFGLSLDTVPAGGSELPADLGGFEPVGVR
jgi:cell division protein FtsB